jgi:hypothetical protein
MTEKHASGGERFQVLGRSSRNNEAETVRLGQQFIETKVSDTHLAL